jgi:hypothetical protein
MSTKEPNKNQPKQLVLELFRDAFPSVSERKDLRALSHDECVHMRSRLAMLKNDDLPYYLRQILEDLLETHTGKAGESQDAEAVVQHLNVLVDGTDLETIRDRLGSGALEQTLVEENYLRSRLAEAYASFTGTQALAISKWLDLAKGWEDLKWYRDEIEAALLYWRHRAANSASAK